MKLIITFEIDFFSVATESVAKPFDYGSFL